MGQFKLFGFWLVILLISIWSLNLAATSALAADLRQSHLWLNSSAAEFSGWQHQGTQVRNEAIQLDITRARRGNDPYSAGGYAGGNYYNGGAYFFGEALSPYYSPVSGFDDAVVSWNALTPAGSWVELRIKALVGTRWTREYTLGVWSSDTGTVRRHSVAGQSDSDGRIETDTLLLNTTASAFQVRALLFSANGLAASTPELGLVAVSTTRKGTNPSQAAQRSAWGRDLSVPERSQMIYPDGGEVWCSPTSTSMVLAYWAAKTGRSELVQTVPTAAARTFDWIYRGNGNWPFNTSWAASLGNLEAYVTRMLSLVQLESWINAGVPPIISLAWQPGQLDGAPLAQTSGHLLVVRGFDAAGNVIVNDPAGDPRLGQSVRLVYKRAQFEQRWLASSGGATYLIYPRGTEPPAALRGTTWPPASGERQKGFADPAIETTWLSADAPIAAGSSNRSWLWGPQPRTTARLESYVEAPEGWRVVQYFDKSRMEITFPQGNRTSKWFVTNGLLTVEMVSGQIQTGDSRYQPASSAVIPVAGDPDSQLAPTYATFEPLVSIGKQQAARRAPNRTGQAVTATLNRSGQVGERSNTGVQVGYYEPQFGHNIPDVMWGWLNDPVRSGLTNGWLFAFGYPITEPYWVQINLNGTPTLTLVQLFERRALTYTPTNPPAFRLEMGNIGQHYLAWRYGQ